MARRRYGLINLPFSRPYTRLSSEVRDRQEDQAWDRYVQEDRSRIEAELLYWTHAIVWANWEEFAEAHVCSLIRNSYTYRHNHDPRPTVTEVQLTFYGDRKDLSLPCNSIYCQTHDDGPAQGIGCSFDLVSNNSNSNAPQWSALLFETLVYGRQLPIPGKYEQSRLWYSVTVAPPNAHQVTEGLARLDEVVSWLGIAGVFEQIASQHDAKSLA